MSRESFQLAKAAPMATLAWLCLLTGAAGAWTLALPDSLEVEATTVRVSDLVGTSVPEAAGQVVVAAGGRPGAVVEVTARTILRRLAMAGLAEGVVLAGAERCRIVFAGHALSQPVLQDRVRELLAAHIPPTDPAAPPSWLELELSDAGIHVGQDWDVVWPQPRPLVPGRNLLTLQVRSGRQQHRLAAVAVLHAYARTATAVSTVARGQAAPAESLQWQWTDLALASPGLITDQQSLNDMIASRDLKPGEVLSQRDLVPRPLVVRGEMVDLVVRRGGVEAVVRVECRQDGLLDQTVSVRNPLNNRLLVARVTGPGQVATGR
jgi:flagella basal body P-ring formation protein FlgA